MDTRFAGNSSQNPDTKDIAVIMVTSKSESTDKVKGLEMGASDYVTKTV